MGSNFEMNKKVKEDEEVEKDDYEQEKAFEEDESSTSSSSAKDDAKRMMMRLMLIVVGVVIFIALILLIASVFMKPKYTYSDLEDVMVSAAKSYFKDNKDQLPQTVGDGVELPVANLINAEYMKPFADYAGDETNCDGSVRVEKTTSGYLYTPQLNCGNDYTTVALADLVTSADNMVSTGYGLYSLNGNYVFRGEEVNNYLELDENLWRIVKIDRNNNIYLISEEEVGMSIDWDDRYNEAASYAAGINNYGSSRIREFLNKVYTDPEKDDGELVLSSRDKKRIIPYNLCIGKRSVNEEGNNNSIECKEILKEQKLGLLTLSDYMAASIDPNCKTSDSHSCSNYNYLVKNYEWWLATANKDSTFEAYQVKTNGSVKSENTSTYANARAVIVLNKNMIYKSGKGTLKNPYKVK